MFGVLYSWCLVLFGLSISWTKTQTLPNSRIPDTSGVERAYDLLQFNIHIWHRPSAFRLHPRKLFLTSTSHERVSKGSAWGSRAAGTDTRAQYHKTTNKGPFTLTRSTIFHFKEKSPFKDLPLKISLPRVLYHLAHSHIHTLWHPLSRYVLQSIFDMFHPLLG